MMLQPFAVLLLCTFFVGCAAAQELTGRDVAVKVDDVDTSSDSMTTATMTIIRGDQQLERILETYNRKFKENDRKFIKFLKPTDVRDVKYLIWGYEDYTKIDDMWVFMPSENLVRRMSRGGMKSSFMRSDFANEDIEETNADDFVTHTILRSEKIGDADCYVIEQIPQKERDTQYSKLISWINKNNFLHMRIDFYNDKGEHFKTGYFTDQEIIDGIWTTTKVTIETPSKNSKTILKYNSIKYNVDVQPSLFDPSVLKR